MRRIPVRHLLLGALAAPSLAELREFSQPMSDADKEEWINGWLPLPLPRILRRFHLIS